MFGRETEWEERGEKKEKKPTNYPGGTEEAGGRAMKQAGVKEAREGSFSSTGKCWGRMAKRKDSMRVKGWEWTHAIFQTSLQGAEADLEPSWLSWLMALP